MNYSIFLSHSGKDSDWAAWVKQEAAFTIERLDAAPGKRQTVCDKCATD